MMATTKHWMACDQGYRWIADLFHRSAYYDTSPYNEEFDWITQSKPEGDGFFYLDHLTHNVFKGNMDVWFKFYGDLFNFREIRFFDIQGKFTGLFSAR